MARDPAPASRLPRLPPPLPQCVRPPGGARGHSPPMLGAERGPGAQLGHWGPLGHPQA